MGIAGSHINSLNSHGIVAVRDREVSDYDLERVIDAARAVAIPADQKIIHILPQEYLIDNQEGIKEPLGMSGVRLEARCIWSPGRSTRFRHRKVHPPLRPRSGRRGAGAAGLQLCGADRRSI